MPRYRVHQPCKPAGQPLRVGSVAELTERQAAGFVREGALSPVDKVVPLAPSFRAIPAKVEGPDSSRTGNRPQPNTTGRGRSTKRKTSDDCGK
jgi:hypothetical protein